MSFGPDGLKIIDAYNVYLEKCDAFLAKARKYRQENMRCKQSVIHSNSFGYESSEELAAKHLQERDRNMRAYNDLFDVKNFNEDKNAMYERSVEKVKRIRIIRELSEPRVAEYGSPFEVCQTWFLRFSNLSRFIQAIRMTILKQRLEKRLRVLRRLTPAMIEELELDGIISSPDVVEDEEKPCEVVNAACPALCAK